jgi:hypothetical protein
MVFGDKPQRYLTCGMKKIRFTVLMLGLASLFAEAQPKTAPGQVWDELLQRHVSPDGLVDYRGFKRDEASLDAYLAYLGRHMPEGDWSREARMAWWINAYNAFTVKRILQYYPVQSMMDIEGGKTWDTRWIRLGGELYSLNQLEHDILRKQFRDARIHFALNCAARSCPPLMNRSWSAATLEATLELRTRAFIRDSRHNRIEEGSLAVSRIFEWYREDFGDVRVFLGRYSEVKVRKDARLTFMTYDWRLNAAGH